MAYPLYHKKCICKTLEKHPNYTKPVVVPAGFVLVRSQKGVVKSQMEVSLYSLPKSASNADLQLLTAEFTL